MFGFGILSGLIFLPLVGCAFILSQRGEDQATLENIRARGLKVVPRCSFVRAYMRGHREFDDLIAK